jgi:hypothetical protein
MTTVLYTPGRLTADSRATCQKHGETVVTTDERAKIRRFTDPNRPMDLSRLIWNGDRIAVAAGAGKSETIDLLMKNIGAYGDETPGIYRQARRVFGEDLESGGCTVLLVGEEYLHVIGINADRHHDAFFTFERLSLQSTKAIGSGSQLALMLHGMFGVPEVQAVAGAGLLDSSTGGAITTCTLDTRDTVDGVPFLWVEETTLYRDLDEQLDDLTDYFANWNVGSSPLKLPQLPKRYARTRHVPVAKGKKKL